jgi:hypothetical protein
MKFIKLSDIIISEDFQNTYPRKWKLDRARTYMAKHGKLDKPIVVDDKNRLLDNYTRYLVALEFGWEEIECVNMREYEVKKL